MPNSNERGLTGPVIELIPKQSSRNENVFFAIAIVVVLVVATLTLLVSQKMTKKVKWLPNELVTLVTQLQNARDEIQMLQEMDVLPAELKLIDLLEQDLEPFSSARFVTRDLACYVSDVDKHQVRFKLESGNWLIHWRVGSNHHPQDDPKTLCRSNNHWQPIRMKKT